MVSFASIIIVNLDGLPWLKICLPSLLGQTYKSFEVILVDNASKDESVKWVREKYPEVNIIVNKNNIGFSQGNNVGYAHAKGDYILFLNNDTKTTPGFLKELIDALENDKTIGGVQSKILLMDDPKRLDSIGAFLTPTGFLYHFAFGQKDSPKFNKKIDLYTAKGACMMFKREVLEKIKVDGKIFDPDFFAYFEETDLCHRVWLAGYRIIYVPTSIIYHKLGATGIRMDNAFIQFHSYKNRMRSYLKNIGMLLLLFFLPLHLICAEIIAFLYFFRRKPSLFFSIQKAILWNVVNMKKTLQMRGYIQKVIRRKSDTSIINQIVKFPSYSYYFDVIRSFTIKQDKDYEKK